MVAVKMDLKCTVKFLSWLLCTIIAITGPVLTLSFDIFTTREERYGLRIHREGSFLGWRETTCQTINGDCHQQDLGTCNIHCYTLVNKICTKRRFKNHVHTV